MEAAQQATTHATSAAASALQLSISQQTALQTEHNRDQQIIAAQREALDSHTDRSGQTGE